MTPAQLHILQHSLGCDKHGTSTSRYPGNDGPYFRNHYVAFANDDLTALVSLGFMTVSGGSELSGDMPLWRVTKKGIEAMRMESPPRPRLSRSKQRYNDYLRSESANTFGEWLKFGGYKPVDRCSTPS